MAQEYLDESGTYCEHGSEWSFGPSKKEKSKWWKSLTEPERKVIEFCYHDEIAQKHGLKNARLRYMMMDRFYSKMTGLCPPKKTEKANFVWNNIEHFKQYLIDNETIKL